jgi:hypothetical protein
MNCTRTTTQSVSQPPEPTALHLLFKLELQFRVVALITEMQLSNLFPQQQLDEFNADLMAQPRMHLQLYFLIYHIIRPSLLLEQDKFRQDTLFDFNRRALEFLQESLPKDVDLDRFLAMCKQLSREFDESQRVWEKIDENSNETVRLAAEKVNEIVQKMLAHCEVIKAELLAINQEEQEITAEFQEKFDLFYSRIQSIIDNNVQIAAQQSENADQMQANHAALENAAEILKQLLKRV